MFTQLVVLKTFSFFTRKLSVLWSNVTDSIAQNINYLAPLTSTRALEELQRKI